MNEANDSARITVNHRHELAWRNGMTVRDVLLMMKYTYPHIVVSINGQVTPYDAYDTTTIPVGADVRVVHLIAGG